MGVASGCGEQEVGVASGSGWNLWVWLLGVVLIIILIKRDCKIFRHESFPSAILPVHAFLHAP